MFPYTAAVGFIMLLVYVIEYFAENKYEVYLFSSVVVFNILTVIWGILRLPRIKFQ